MEGKTKGNLSLVTRIAHLIRNPRQPQKSSLLSEPDRQTQPASPLRPPPCRSRQFDTCCRRRRRLFVALSFCPRRRSLLPAARLPWRVARQVQSSNLHPPRSTGPRLFAFKNIPLAWRIDGCPSLHVEQN
ncbi:hypothetical protein CDV36_013051 [Fusarium kuroshium]|uniref:Uncharacterized protein n=1 Tax=Fusarium kuroshium TaxID=2010991 RepID=A0A3M2RQ52_9HYPO|nr:hypothetical protein CDV36_013051 [Fusarium kuroshium]